MSLVDDARRLADSWPTHCPACGAWLQANGEHVPDCPWPSMAGIVAALEAAERLMIQSDAEPSEYSRGEDCHYRAFCERPEAQGHEPDCPWQALVAVLRGEEVKA